MSDELNTAIPNTSERPNREAWSGFRRMMTVVIMGILLAFSGLALSVLFNWPADFGNIYARISLAAIILWFGILIDFYVWLLYFYNVNFGYTDHAWENLLDRFDVARERKELGLPFHEEDLILPDVNPYKGETLGLPNGTVRGTLALTLLVGGFAILIYSFDTNAPPMNDQFNFFLQAFTMMVAFYFGTKALSILESQTGNTVTDADVFTGGATVPGVNAPSTTVQPNSLIVPTAATVAGTQIIPASSVGNPQLAAELNKRQLGDQDLRVAALDLGVEIAALKAVIEVEVGMNAQGFLSDGRPKILFEGHVFWRELKKVGVDPAPHAERFPSIVYERWTREHYRGGAGEYDRLDIAVKIHREAALKSASWGIFQIMGFNYKAAGHSSVQRYVNAMFDSAADHLFAFTSFIRKTKNGVMRQALKDKDWTTFAKNYNGPGFAQNNYHTRMAEAYRRYKRIEEIEGGSRGGGVRLI